ncbi:hypothetical protein KAFR_0A03920 [Kazachstania africana CBS 2517]|uniref:Anaphase-promoting complex subunit 5 n=1 Tax=Kazachstania africana (strain ATCC 22294 / BCRC 22015 / CBS 2517 / CECT 1963 / NBRC 1671 / NRRL Y-8276) TaxID=1071382 RepID=H2AN77_KAZAF|nr:hypothetical protein KAFR_0A03920 [Kazachstania africana CBS 2517]CCF55827.1 hypothetical protein KAFR_0A03920 [Kazachstania africana CBS 2517]
MDEVKIGYSLTPHHISVIVLIYLYCLRNTDVTLEIFLKLISPTIEPLDFNPIINNRSNHDNLEEPPLLPTLEDIVRYLLLKDEKTLALKLMKALQTIESIDIVSDLLTELKQHCIVDTYKRQKEIQVAKGKIFTKTSFIGRYITSCIARKSIGNLDDRESLRFSFANYLDTFEKTQLYEDLSEALMMFNFEFDIAVEKDGGNDMVQFLKHATKDLPHESRSNLMLSAEHLRNLLNWQMFRISTNQGEDLAIMEIVDSVSLQLLTRLPSIHMLKYLRYLQTNSYQDALDSLHNYFDYMVTRGNSQYFHMSLLCLATFHTHFNDSVAAIKTFDEATKVARENKDTESLNLILVWLINFIEEHPEYSAKFQLQVDQIIKFLRSSNETVNISVFENAYRYESLISLRENHDTIQLLESSFKYLIIALQQPRSKESLRSMMSYYHNLWNTLGYTTLSEVYSAQYTLDEVDLEISTVNEELEKGETRSVRTLLEKLSLPNLKYNQIMGIKLLEVKYLIFLKEFNNAMGKLLKIADNSVAVNSDYRWKFEFDKEKCRIFLSTNQGQRCLPLLQDMIRQSKSNKHPLQCVECMLLLSEVLVQVHKREEAKMLLEENLAAALQFPRYKNNVTRLISKLR